MKTITATSLAALFLSAWPALAPCGEVPAAPATGGITVGDEVVLMADGPGKTRRAKPAVAFGKDNYLVAWQEGWYGEGGSSRIYALRVGLDGKPLDAKAVELAPCKTGVQENPRVAFFNGVFLVVWQDIRNGEDCDVLAARVSAEGKVLDAQPIAIAAAPRTQAMPDVAADDKGFMVAWHGFQGEETEAKVFAARVGADGTAGQAVVVTDGASPRIAWNGKDFLLVCSGVSQVRNWLLMDVAGKPLSKPIRITAAAGGQYSPIRYSTCALPGGKGWAIVTHSGTPNVLGRSMGIQRVIRVTADGQKDVPADDWDFAPKGAAPPANWLDTHVGKKGVWPYGGSAVAADGQCCVAVWQRYHTGGATRCALENGDILASRVDGWKPLDKEGVPVAASAAEELDPALAGNGAGKLLCAYEKMENGKSKIVARTLDTK